MSFKQQDPAFGSLTHACGWFRWTTFCRHERALRTESVRLRTLGEWRA